MKKPSIDIVHLFPVLNKELISFLRRLSPADWQPPTVAKLWLTDALEITGGGEWYLLRSNNQWKLTDGDAGWKLFTKSVRKEEVAGSYSIKGDIELGETILNMVSVMA